MILDHIGRGPKAAIPNAIEQGILDTGDIVVTNGEKGNELVIIERDNTPVVIKSRTQEAITVMGVNLSSEVADGKTLPAGMDLDEFIKKLVQKRIAATYTQPSVKIANNSGQAATTVEAGSTVSIKVKSTFTKADAGNVTNHIIKLNGTEKASGTDTVLTYDDAAYVVPDGATNLASSVTYAEGAIKNDNFGDASPSGHIAAGTKSSSNYTITGARKAFYGAITGALPTVDSAFIRGLAGSTLNPAAANKINVTIPEGAQHLVVSLPKGRTLSQVTYVDLGDKGMLSKFTQSVVAVAGASDSVSTNDNNVYVYSMAAPAAAAMNFELLLA